MLAVLFRVMKIDELARKAATFEWLAPRTLPHEVGEYRIDLLRWIGLTGMETAAEVESMVIGWLWSDPVFRSHQASGQNKVWPA